MPTTNPVKKKLTHVAVSICGTIMFRFFLSMPVIIVGSESICCEGLSFFVFWLNTPVACGRRGRVRGPR